MRPLRYSINITVDGCVDQLTPGTGGPKDEDMLMSAEKLRAEFQGLKPVLLRELERDVMEGTFHTGRAAVVQFVGRKL
jgi:hypothetical protein